MKKTALNLFYLQLENLTLTKDVRLDETIKALEHDIAEHGLIEPLVVRRSFVVDSGNRRLRAIIHLYYYDNEAYHKQFPKGIPCIELNL